jgi:rare lipoprotein A
VIDLSYAAALKLDLLKSGVADVKLDVIHVDKTGNVTVGPLPVIANNDKNNAEKQVFIQVVASQNKKKIQTLALGLKNLYQRTYKTTFEKGIYKLRLGPMENEYEADKLLNELKRNDYPSAYKVYSE